VGGAGAWESHIGLNESVVVDLFQGQLKQVLRCSRCGHESPSYETFQYLPVPLPAVLTTLHVRVFPYVSHSERATTPGVHSIIYTVRVPQTGCVGDLIKELRKVMGAPDELVLTPVEFNYRVAVMPSSSR
jgi:hypothetical protein